jgi:hypothetical protein
MPLYTTKCKRCGVHHTIKLSFQEYDLVQAGTKDLACACGGAKSLIFDPITVSFILRDGESGGWISKAGKENTYRAKRHQVMARRERDHVRPNRLQPNFQGQSAESWKEARDAAYQSTYQKAKDEHGAITAAKVASESAKTYDPYVKREVT